MVRSDGDRRSGATTSLGNRLAPLGAGHEWVTLLSYHIPTYEVGRRRLYVGVWKHGVSIYGW